jgi:hypothetical protein
MEGQVDGKRSVSRAGTVFAQLLGRMTWTDSAARACPAVKATALATPLSEQQRPHRCLSAGGTSHMVLLATSSHFSLAHLRAVNVKSLRLAGEHLWRGTSEAWSLLHVEAVSVFRVPRALGQEQTRHPPVRRFRQATQDRV